ncbi:pyruvate,orthophosphate dikinase [Bacilli bacterium PM5-3]|nr:pyruvate,orthophosphate dikinase [Bacilli bacterium PM5-3]MDH6603443.1 pyruvate,orthophosphate dikinase [Bacilli bacterium PM5-9]
MATKYTYLFNQGNRSMVNLLGGKGANLAYMANKGLPVPPGFTITTQACNEYYENDCAISNELQQQIDECLKTIEELTNKEFGGLDNPLLVSVRSGAPVSMPGMMDTVLNLGLNDETVKVLAKKTNNERFALDSYRRFIQIFSDVVLEISRDIFEDKLNEVKAEFNAVHDNDLTIEALNKVILGYKEIVKREHGHDFYQDVRTQLKMAIEAVFKSWQNDRAIIYRDLHSISHNIGTAVNVQSMVFGNFSDQSGTGVLFTRNPITGDNEIFGEYLINAQGEDVVAGIRTPMPLSKLSEEMPKVYEELYEIVKKMEISYKDVQDVEFTIEDGKLYFLQTRSAKRTAMAALKIAIDMYNEGTIDKITALTRVNPEQVEQLLHPSFDSNVIKDIHPISKGLPASPGAANGRIYFDAKTIAQKAGEGEETILVRHETTPDDIEGMIHCKAVLTSTGGMTSHAAVVARGMGRICIVGCQNIELDYKTRTVKIGDKVYNEGDWISVDGSTGSVYEGKIETETNVVPDQFKTLMEWADEYALMEVRANVDNAADAQKALDFGATGIGLCRTEHMFFGEDRISDMQRMILADDKETRIDALEKLYPYQKDDFKAIYKVMKELPVTIRLLDPPLHEFLPHTDEDVKKLSKQINLDEKTIIERSKALEEVNPMLGHRGCRLAITYPEIYAMQARAIIKAAVEVNNELGINIVPYIKIPLVIGQAELVRIRKMLVEVVEEEIEALNAKLDYKIGIMIETPRACLVAEELAEHSDFFSFGTNDLTQMTYGFSRDDFSKFSNDYLSKKILPYDPFAQLDDQGVGKLVQMAVEQGRKVNPNLKIGVCGEHGGETNSVLLCHKYGLDYVSCSPYRISLAKLVIAQATAFKLLSVNNY